MILVELTIGLRYMFALVEGYIDYYIHLVRRLVMNDAMISRSFRELGEMCDEIGFYVILVYICQVDNRLHSLDEIMKAQINRCGFGDMRLRIFWISSHWEHYQD
jgi:hypothetical protein